MISTTPVTFSLKGNDKTISLTVANELMKSYTSGLPIDSRHKVAAVQDHTGSPIFFSIGTNGKLYVIYRAENSTGWDQIDIGSGLSKIDTSLGSNPTATEFAVMQSRSGSVRLAVAMRPTADAADLLYMTDELDLKTIRWEDLSAAWVPRPHDLGEAAIEKIILGPSSGTQEAPLVLVVTHQHGEDKRYFVNGNLHDTRWVWKPYPIPHNADHLLDVAVGSLRTLPGTWALYQVGNKSVLEFTSIPTPQIPQPININYKDVPAGAQVLGTLPGTNGIDTDLYVAGDGLHVYKASTMPPRAVQIATPKQFPAVSELILAEDGEAVSVWGLTGNEELIYTHGPLKTVDVPAAWSTPIPLFRDVSQIAPLRNRIKKSNEIVLVTNDNQLKYLWQDPSTTLWQTDEIAIHSTGDVITCNSYATILHVAGKAGKPQEKVTFSMRSSSWRYVTVNGHSHRVDPTHPISVTTDNLGDLRIITPIPENMTSPVYYFRIEGMDQEFEVRPESALHRKLHEQAATLSDATYRYGERKGQKVLQGDYATQNAGAASKIVTTLSKISLSHAEDSSTKLSHQGVRLRTYGEEIDSKVNTSSLPSNFGFGFQQNQTTVQYQEGDQAKEIISNIILIANPLAWLFGDMMRHFVEHIQAKPAGFFMHLTAEGVLELITDLGESFVQAVVDEVEQISHLIQYVLRDILHLDTDKLLEWLGFVFDWKDILATKDVIVNLVTDQLLSVEEGIQTVETSIEGVISKVQGMVRQMKPIHSEIGTKHTSALQNEMESWLPQTSSGDLLDQLNEFITSSPLGRSLMNEWLIQPLFHLVKEIQQEFAWLEELATDLGKNALGTLVDEIGNTADTVQLLVDDINKLAQSGAYSANDVINQLLGDTFEGTLGSVKVLIRHSFSGCASVVKAMRKGINTKVYLPILSGIYKDIVGSDLTLLDALALAVAVPCSALSKIIFRKPLFHAGERLPVFRIPAPNLDQLIPVAQSFDQLGSYNPSIVAADSRLKLNAYASADATVSGEKQSDLPDVGTASYAMGIVSLLFSVVSDLIDYALVADTAIHIEGKKYNLVIEKPLLAVGVVIQGVLGTVNGAMTYPSTEETGSNLYLVKVFNMILEVAGSVINSLVAIAAIWMPPLEIWSLVMALGKCLLSSALEMIACVMELVEAKVAEDEDEDIRQNKTGNAILKLFESALEAIGESAIEGADYSMGRLEDNEDPRAKAIGLVVGSIAFTAGEVSLFIGNVIELARIAYNFDYGVHHKLT